MLSFLMGSTLRNASVAAMAVAICLVSMSEAFSQYPTQHQENVNGLRSDHRTYRVPDRVSMRQRDNDPQSRRMRQMREERPAEPSAQGDRPVRQVRQTSASSSKRRGTSVRQANFQRGYVPQHVRTARNANPPILNGRRPVRSTVANRLAGFNEEEIYYDEEVGMPVEEFIDGDCGDCSACDVGSPCIGGFCDRPNRGVCGCGDVHNCQECWLNGVGGLICNTEFFSGAHAFDLMENGQTVGRGFRTGQFGFHGGVNIGLPLKRLTCGLVSGQVGASIYQSEFGGDGALTNETREQVFFTAGLFRRVDYGLQFGTVADILFEDWFYKTEMVQMRSEVSYVYGDGSLLGFRFTIGVQDGGLGHPNGVLPDVLDTYRFFWRMPAFNGLGYAEAFGGFTEESQGLIGTQTDVNITRLLAVQSGFTYVWENQVNDDSWNVFMRVVLRPQARNWYRNYHRPFMPVADNGSMMTIWR